jgi:hypothetical protein
MKNDPERFNVKELQALVSALKLSDPKMNEYINARWLKYVQWWDSRSRRAKRCHQWLRAVVVVSGASIPALVGLRELQQLQSVAWLFAIAAIVVSLVVAICTGLESVFRCGEIWREKRMATELIVSEGFSFLQLTGTYANSKTHHDGFKLFAQNVEEMIRREIKDYVVATSPQPLPPAEPPPKLKED